MTVAYPESYRHLIGKTLIEKDEEHRVPRTNNHVLQRELPNKHRLIKPGFTYSADSIDSRLNVSINAKKQITGVILG
ncbi:hypothetical protein CONCODRAFT_78943 [Conidiobolus coronatus NRRL 28638]|uniref:Uncharacterized protein n=1 Tax=Conidiobolus coronatus (strain ATCC 28846 / CBS 209.66 / NRRL 28638) TaxID=796925 RepID=A0A137P5I8_CONC2|nr:hypothetical protein CONCODRAFT_78943 [Conidiobolus coronatus NRRL 28638]|eukprot:KXN70275.1 hypothetical protein CONCODRAFT_78943 [Conidiobolus coronatus NRRL 28638]